MARVGWRLGEIGRIGGWRSQWRIGDGSRDWLGGGIGGGLAAAGATGATAFALFAVALTLLSCAFGP